MCTRKIDRTKAKQTKGHSDKITCTYAFNVTKYAAKHKQGSKKVSM